jgi:hypothetical protein
MLCGDHAAAGPGPRIYFRLLLIGYVERIDSKRSIARLVGDSFSIRDFTGITVDQRTVAVLIHYSRRLFADGICDPAALHNRPTPYRWRHVEVLAAPRRTWPRRSSALLPPSAQFRSSVRRFNASPRRRAVTASNPDRQS